MSGKVKVPSCRWCGAETDNWAKVCSKCRNDDGRRWRESAERIDVLGRLPSTWERLGGKSNAEWLSFAKWAREKTRTFAALLEAIEDPAITQRCRKYGITDLDYARALIAQAGCCAICGTGCWIRSLNIDHDHITGHVRGLLCTPCNIGIGHLGLDGQNAAGRAHQITMYFRRVNKHQKRAG
jgi:hypothetical protein